MDLLLSLRPRTETGPDEPEASPDRPLRRPSLRCNLIAPSPRLRGYWLRVPAPRPGIVDDRPTLLAPRVQLFRSFPVPRTPVMRLHRVGYVVVPYRAAPQCSRGSGPYGRIIWIRTDRPSPLPLCEYCETGRMNRQEAR